MYESRPPSQIWQIRLTLFLGIVLSGLAMLALLAYLAYQHPKTTLITHRTA